MPKRSARWDTRPRSTAFIRRERSLKKLPFGSQCASLQVPSRLQSDWPSVSGDVLAGNNAVPRRDHVRRSSSAWSFTLQPGHDALDRPLDPSDYRDLVRRALAEDLGSGDVTTGAIVPADRSAQRHAHRQEPLRRLRSRCRARDVHPGRCVGAVRTASRDGDPVDAGTTIAVVSRPAARAAHRRAHGAQFPAASVGHCDADAAIRGRDRRTPHDPRHAQDAFPACDALAKYAVRCGGGTNHRVRPLRRRADQGQSHPSGRRHRRGRAARARARRDAADRSRGAEPRRGGSKRSSPART